MKTAKVNFCVDLDYPSYISGNYYFSLTGKEKSMNPERFR